jgi:signal transduction histidine kinase
MEPRPDASLSEMLSDAAGRDGPPFRGPGLLARVWPFALVAVAAEASLALPPGMHAWTAVAVSLVLLAATGLAFLLPWDRLPAWMTVVVPLAYTGSALALNLAGGTDSGVGMVLLIPLIWTVLFHRRWESACVLAAVVAAVVVISVVQSAPDAVIVRRVLLWSAIGGLLAVATHGLRDRIRRSQETAAQLQQRLVELMVVQDRDRLATDLQSTVVKRIFAAGLSLQSVLALAAPAEVRRRMESAVSDLDDAVRLLRRAIFGLEHRLDAQALRQQVLRLCVNVSPVPEVTFVGPVDDVLPPEAADQSLDLLRLALGVLGSYDGPTFICVTAGESLSFIVTRTGHQVQPVNGNGTARAYTRLRERASQDGIPIEIGPVPGGTRLVWSLPIGDAGQTSPADLENGPDQPA